MKIVGYTVGTSLPKPDFKQTDPSKGDYIKNKPDFAGLKSKVDDIEEALNIDYESILAFDVTEIVICNLTNTNTSSVLGQAILGQLVLA